jgi:hypothetical protein
MHPTLPTGLKIAAPGSSTPTTTAVEAAPNLPHFGIDFVISENGWFRSVDLLYWIAVLFWGRRVIILSLLRAMAAAARVS